MYLGLIRPLISEELVTNTTQVLYTAHTQLCQQQTATDDRGYDCSHYLLPTSKVCENVISCNFSISSQHWGNMHIFAIVPCTGLLIMDIGSNVYMCNEHHLVNLTHAPYYHSVIHHILVVPLCTPSPP